MNFANYINISSSESEFSKTIRFESRLREFRLTNRYIGITFANANHTKIGSVRTDFSYFIYDSRASLAKKITILNYSFVN